MLDKLASNTSDLPGTVVPGTQSGDKQPEFGDKPGRASVSSTKDIESVYSLRRENRVVENRSIDQTNIKEKILLETEKEFRLLCLRFQRTRTRKGSCTWGTPE